MLTGMRRYLISFDDGSMDHISAEDLPTVADESRAVVAAAKAAGVWIWGGGLFRQRARVVGTDGSVADGAGFGDKPMVGGFSIVEVDTPQEGLDWAARIAAACRCAQEVREIMYDPES